MRISDWSSDVCSSDLPPDALWSRDGRSGHLHFRHVRAEGAFPAAHPVGRGLVVPGLFGAGLGFGSCQPAHDGRARRRSEEHTSELQSLMRISYAVFCLKKKKKIQHYTTERQSTRSIDDSQVKEQHIASVATKQRIV